MAFVIKNTIKDYIYICLLILPICCYWIFPASLEETLTFKIFGLPIFTPEFCWLFCVLFKRKYSFEPFVYKRFIYLGLSMTLLSILISLVNDTIKIITYSTTIDLFIPLVILGIYPIYKRQYPILLRMLLFIWILLCLQVFLYSFGILKYDNIVDSYYGEISRISTTIGAATGTGIIIFMLTAFILYLTGSKIKRVQFYLIILVSSISILLTMARGSILAMTIFLLFLIFNNNINLGLSFRSKILIVLLYFISFGLLQYKQQDLATSLLERVIITIESNDITTGRDIRWLTTVASINKNLTTGVGMGMYNSGKRALIAKNNTVEHNYSPHNLYLLLGAEIGIIGLLVYIVFVSNLYIFSGLCFKSSLVIVFWIVVILFNIAEVVFRDMEFSILFFLIFSLSLAEKYEDKI